MMKDLRDMLGWCGTFATIVIGNLNLINEILNTVLTLASILWVTVQFIMFIRKLRKK